MCNGHKADRIEALDPVSKSMMPLFNPRQDTWQGHFEWTGDGTTITGRTAKGRAIVSVLAMNHPDMMAARRLWVAVGWHPPVE